jgi:hypothetical protein
MFPDLLPRLHHNYIIWNERSIVTANAMCVDSSKATQPIEGLSFERWFLTILHDKKTPMLHGNKPHLVWLLGASHLGCT